MIAGLVLAAGAGERFGGPKQLAPLDGRPLLEHVLAAMAAVPLDRTLVMLGAHADAILAAVPLHGAEPLVVEGWREGMAASLRAGVGALADAEAVAIALGDQPLLAPEAVARVIAGRDGTAPAVRASYGGVPAHPVLLERQLFGRVQALRGDAGARVLLAQASAKLVPCDGLGRPDDVDSPEALRLLGCPKPDSGTWE